MSADLKISQLASASALTGAELVPLVQGGANVRATVSALASTAPVTATGGSEALTLADWMAKFNDRSSVEGDATTFFNPDYFGNPGDGTYVEFNRVRVGDFGDEGFDRVVGPPRVSDPSWAEENWASSSSASNLAVMSTIGGIAISGFARSSAYNGWIPASATGGAQAINGFTLNDGTVGHPIVCSILGSSLHAADCTGITETCELQIASARAPTTISPFTGLPGGGGTTVALNVNCGWPPGGGWDEDVSAAIYIAGGSHGPTFQKGIVFNDGGLTADTDASFGQVAIELASGQLLRWVTASTVDARLYSDANGLISVGARFVQTSGGGLSTVEVRNDTTGATATDGMYFGYVGSNLNGFLINKEAGTLTIGTSNAAALTISTANAVTFSAGVLGAGKFTSGSAVAIPAGGSTGVGFAATTTANFGIFFGSGVPTLSAAKGSLYLRSDGTTTNDRAYINTNGTTTWTALTTAG